MSHPRSCLCASAPGSLMLMGEHAVLHGSHALCAAVNKRIRVSLHPRSDTEITIESSLGMYGTTLDNLTPKAPFHFVLTAIQQSNPSCGFDLTIQADFASTLGFASSAAVTVATLTVLRALDGRPFDRAGLLEQALTVVRTVQGTASGSDLAAAVFGGVVHYRADPLYIEPIHASLPLAACYAGYKTPTPEVIRRVEANRLAHPERFASIFALMNDCVHDAVAALRTNDRERIGQLFNLHHGLQAALGCSDETLEYLVHRLRAQDGVLGAKISGSGLGDCVIALGNSDAAVIGYENIPIELDTQGVILES
ncbi:MAG: galactokinase family protein [Kiritimatiellia bacterium]